MDIKPSCRRAKMTCGNQSEPQHFKVDAQPRFHQRGDPGVSLSSRGESWKLEVAGEVRGLEITRIQPRAQQRLP
jgi:hypothetical protein